MKSLHGNRKKTIKNKQVPHGMINHIKKGKRMLMLIGLKKQETHYEYKHHIINLRHV